jgi:thiamine pyrophosphate-dependent acetolactate synthase large subunit-like protein
LDSLLMGEWGGHRLPRDGNAGADAAVEFIENHLAPHVFGLPGSSSVALFHRLASSKASFVPSLQENAAVALADGYARFAGPTAVLLYMLPGIATGLSNLYNASRDETPLLVMASQVGTRSRWMSGAVGEADTAALAAPFAASSREVTHRAQLDETLTAAFRFACGPPSGPAVVVVPEDIWSQDGPTSSGPTVASQRAVVMKQALAPLVDRLISSERPLIIVGGQLRRCGGAVHIEALAQALAVPVMYEPFWNDRLGVSPGHPMCLGQLGEHSQFAHTADFVLGLGCRLFNEVQPRTSPWFASAYVAHVNADLAKLATSRPAADWSAAADPGATSAILRAAVEQADVDAGVVERRRQRFEEARARRAVPRATPFTETAAALRDELDRAYVVDESVTASLELLAAFRSATNGARYVSTTGGSLGWSTGAAAGVALATGSPVTCVLGDGAFFFGLPGLWQAVSMRLPVTYVVLDNGGFGSTKDFEQQYVNRLSGEPGQPIHALGSDFTATRPPIVEVARGLGVPGSDIQDGDHLEQVLAESRSGPRLLRVSIGDRR